MTIPYYFTINEIFHFSTYLPAFGIVTFYLSNSNRYVVMPHSGPNFIALKASRAEHLFMCLFVTHISSLMKCIFVSLACFLTGILILLYSRYEFFVRYIVCKYFLLVHSLSFNPLHMVFCTAEVFNCDKMLFINIFSLWILLLLSCLRTFH